MYQPFIGRVPENKVVFKKLQATAEYPYVDKQNSSCYNVTLIARTDSRSEDNHMEVNTFHTGLSVVSIPHNSFVEIIPHPSLYKNGYMLVGPIVIDNATKGELIIPLYKYKDVDCIDLPFPAVQLVVKATMHVFISSDETKKQQSDDIDSQNMNIIYQAESSSSGAQREQAFKGSSKRGKSKTNHIF